MQMPHLKIDANAKALCEYKVHSHRALALPLSDGLFNVIISPFNALALAAVLTLQSEWVLYPFLSVAANANALCERTIRP